MIEKSDATLREEKVTVGRGREEHAERSTRYQVYIKDIKSRRKPMCDSSRKDKHGILTYASTKQQKKPPSYRWKETGRLRVSLLFVSQLQSAEISRLGIEPATGGLSSVGCATAPGEKAGGTLLGGDRRRRNGHSI
jgi:hypothetical protein